MKNHMEKTEAFLRLSSVLLLVLSALLIGLDHQTKFVFFAYRKASFDNVRALVVLVYVDAVFAGYNLLRLFGQCSSKSSAWVKSNSNGSNINLAWLSLLLDQMAAYVVFGANSAALQASVLAMTGLPDFQWMKLCNKYSKFCSQIGGGLMCGYVACLLLISISSITAFNLFRQYSPKQLLLLKSISD